MDCRQPHQLRTKIVEEERVQHLEDVGDTGVVQPEGAALVLFSDCLDHGPEDVRVELAPTQLTRVQQIPSRHAGEARHIGLTGERPPLT